MALFKTYTGFNTEEFSVGKIVKIKNIFEGEGCAESIWFVHEISNDYIKIINWSGTIKLIHANEFINTPKRKAAYSIEIIG